MVGAMVVGAIAGGLANGIVTKYQTQKLANAYKKYAKNIRGAAEKYSGHNADVAMTEAGNQQGQKSARMALERGLNTQTNDSNLSMVNAQNNMANTDGYNAMMEGQSLGRNLKANDLNAAYNIETEDARQALNRAQMDYAKGKAAAGELKNLGSNLISTGNNIGGMQAAQGLGNSITSGVSGLGAAASSGGLGGLAALTSDENAKEYNNHSGLPKADAEDALRQIESIEYQYKPETGLDRDKHVGVTAQSLQGTAFDDDVKKDGKYLTLDKQKLLESTLAGCASLQKEIDRLKAVKDYDSERLNKGDYPYGYRRTK